MSAAVPPSLASLRAMVERWVAAEEACRQPSPDYIELERARYVAKAEMDAALSPSLLLRLIADAETVQHRDYRTFTGCAHAMHEGCERCLCPTCHSPAVELKDLGWVPMSTLYQALDAARSPHTGGEG